MSRQEGTGKKLPPTPTKPSNVVVNRKLVSLPATPSRQLPKTRTPSEESYYKSDYNEDYNYAYRSQDNLPQDNSYPANLYGTQQDSLDQARISGKNRHTDVSQDNQYASTYGGQLDDSYAYRQDSQTRDAYDRSYAQNSYKDEYRQTYAQDKNVDIYQKTYEEATYPNASQANDQFYLTTVLPNDQYTNISNDRYEKGQEMIIENNYQVESYDRNNVQYQETYNRDDTYQKQYDGYDPSCGYVQNNVSNEYNQYQEYDSEYNISTSTDYQNTYQDNTYNEVPVTTQDNYQDAYIKQQQGDYTSSYEVPYTKEETVPTTYQNDYQDRYENYQEERYDESAYPESYQESYQDSYHDSYEERYKDGPAAVTERRQSEVPELSVTTPKGQTKTNGYPSSESEYLYNQENEQVSQIGASRRKKLGKREPSPLLQQNTDSLESRDDELKDSFETAVSSVESSQPRKAYSEYSTAGDSSPAAATLVDSPQSTTTQPLTSMVNHVASIDDHVSGSGIITVTATVHSSTSAAANGKRLARTDSYLEEAIEDEEEYPEIIPTEPQRKDSQLSHQSQLSQHSSTHSQKPKLTRGDSYASDHFPEESYSRRGSYAQPTRKESISSVAQEPFKPPLTRTDSYQNRGTGYSQNFGAPQPITRAESCQRGYFDDQETIDEGEITLSNQVNGEYKMRDETLDR